MGLSIEQMKEMQELSPVQLLERALGMIKMGGTPKPVFEALIEKAIDDLKNPPVPVAVAPEPVPDTVTETVEEAPAVEEEPAAVEESPEPEEVPSDTNQ